MELLIVPNAARTHADVFVAAEHDSTVSTGARVIGPGESFLSIPYWVWRGHAGQTVDLLSTRASFPVGGPDGTTGSPEDDTAPVVNLHVGQVLDTAFKLIRRAPLLLGAIALILQIPPSYVAASVPAEPTRVDMVRVLLLMPWDLMGVSLLIVVLAQVHSGARPDLRLAAITAARRAHAVLGTALVAGILAGLASAFHEILGIIVRCLLFATPAVALLEPGGTLRALRRSWKLGRGARWSVFLLYGVLLALGYLIRRGAVLMEAGGGPLAFASPVLGFTGRVFLYVLSAAVITSLYVALRVAREGYDVELMTNRLGPADAPATA